MATLARTECSAAVQAFVQQIPKNIRSGRVLYVGIAGDPPGGEYSKLFEGAVVRTMDNVATYRPDIVDDISASNQAESTWDVVVCVQVLEHVPNVWNVPLEMCRLLRPGGFAIVDCPWMYPYHATESFSDYWRISKDGMRHLFGQVFQVLDLREGKEVVSCLLRKPV